MTEETPAPNVPKPIRAFSRSAIPLYSIFFVWGIGTGFQQFGRPLFVASLGVQVFLVTMIGAMNSAASLFAAPLTGFLTDRFGRKPIMMIGNCLRGIASGLQFFCTNYVQFAILEIIGTFGVSMFNTGTSIVMADITERENRGRANAVRGMSLRVGSIGGPLIGAVLVSAYGLRSLFLFNFFTKILILIVMWLRVRETRPEEAARPASSDGTKPAEPGLDFRIFLTPPVLVVVFSTLAYSMMGFAGIIGYLFPLHVEEAAGLQHSDVGSMMAVAGATTLAASYPNGMFVDRFGRKKSMVLGLFVLACSAYLLVGVGDYWSVLVMIIVYGLGEGLSQGASEVYAMDLAPTRGRGAFMGVWSVFRNASGILVPLLVGAVAQNQGLTAAFTIVAAVLAFCGVLVTIFGREPSSVRRAGAD